MIGWDSDARGCGFSDEVKDYPHLYWSQPPDVDLLLDAIKTLNYEKALDILKTGTCVKDCPGAPEIVKNDQGVVTDMIFPKIKCVPTSKMTSDTHYDGGCVYNMDIDFLLKLFGDSG